MILVNLFYLKDYSIYFYRILFKVPSWPSCTRTIFTTLEQICVFCNELKFWSKFLAGLAILIHKKHSLCLSDSIVICRENSNTHFSRVLNWWTLNLKFCFNHSLTPRWNEKQKQTLETDFIFTILLQLRFFNYSSYSANCL